MKPDTKDDAAMASPLKPLAIIGLGCLFPKADNLETYWANIRDGVDCITDIPPTHWNPDDYFDPDKKARDMVYAKTGGFLNAQAVDPMEVGVAPRDIEATDTTQLLGLLAVKQALTDAGYGPGRDFDREHTSVILGVTGALEMVIPLGARLGHPIWRKALQEAGVGQDVADDVVRRIAGSYVEWQENSFPGLLGNVAAGRIANRFDLGGTNCVVDAACASSLGAVHLAALELSSGRSNMVITGGADTFNDIFMYACFSKTPAISATGHARPFDANGDGTILGEGIGIIVLKRLEDAEKDGDRIYAVIRSIGSSSDGKGNAIYAPSAKGQVKALRRAYAQSGLAPETIELIEAHGTGTVVGDGIELQALLEVFNGEGPKNPWCSLGSVKSQIGHTKAAAGSSGLIKTAMALKNKTLPPTIKVREPLAALQSEQSPFYLNSKARPWMPGDHPRRAGLSSFGFGGSNFHLVLEEYDTNKTDIDWDGRIQIAAFSAPDRAGISAALDRMPDSDWSALRSFARETRLTYAGDAPCRLVLVLEQDVTDIGKLKNACRQRLQSDDPAWSLPDGAWFGSGPAPGKLALLFPGQGSQYVGMLRDTALRFPQMFQVLAAANQAFSRTDQDGPAGALCDFIYPVHDITDQDREAAEAALKDTRVAQPAIGAVALGLYRVLEYFGVQGDLAAGHSYGELVALCASGRYEESDLHRLSGVRGRLMAKTNGKQGSMLAVRSGAEQVRALIESRGLADLVVANKNAPEQTVISGGVEQIDQAADAFAQAGFSATRLKVSNAFHSHLMTSAKGPFEDALSMVPFQPARMPVYANSTAAPYPAADAASREILAGQLVRPVEFIDQIQNMYDAGVGTFLEVGPGKSLTGLVGAILKGKPVHRIAVDGSKGVRSSVVDLARTLAHLSALGHGPDLTRWDDAHPAQEQKSSKFTVSVCGANQFVKKPLPPAVKPTGPATCSAGRAGEPIITPTSTPRQVRTPVSNEPKFIQDTIVKKEFQDHTTSPAAAPPDGGVLRDALRLTQDNIQTLQRMQTQTADLHRQFLTGQEKAQENLHDLIRQQQYLLEKTFGGGQASGLVLPESRPLAAPAPTAPQPAVFVPPAPVYPAAAPAPTPAPPVIEPVPAPVQPAQSASAAPDRERIMSVLVEVVSANTGYPVEMLDPDMSLDADLGIDSIKRVEILSTLSERLPDIPAAGPDEVGKLGTLREVVDFLSSRSGNGGSSKAAVECIPGISVDLVVPALLRAVSEHTGYPIDMLELDMKLDADLGIDSIKRVEILSALAEAMPDLPVVEPDQAGRLQTLREVADFLTAEKKNPESGRLNASSPADSCLCTPALDESALDPAVWQAVSESAAELTGFEADTLAPGMSLEADLGIDPVKLVSLLESVGRRLDLDPGRPRMCDVDTLGSLARHFAIERPADSGSRQAVPPNYSRSIDRLVVEPVLFSRPGTDNQIGLPLDGRVWVTESPGGLSEALVHELTDRGARAEVWPWQDLETLQVPEDLTGLVIVSPPGDLPDDFPLHAFQLVQRTVAALKSHRRSTPSFLATVSRLDGRFGLSDRRSSIDPRSGCLAGLAKTAFHEWPDVAAKAFDLDLGETDLAGAARMMADEMTLRGPMEVGLYGGQKFTVQVRPEPLSFDRDALTLQPSDVVLVSGGARGVTAEAALALARKWRPTLVLMGRTELPEHEPDWLAGLTDAAAIKKALFQRSETRITPAQVEAAYRRIESAREVRRNLARLRQMGSKALYLAVDVTDAAAVRAAVTDIRRDLGPVKGLVHGAGVLADRFIQDKTADQFTLVYNTKAGGLSALLDAAQDDPLRFMAFFSSSTGRFGRSGQVDYAMANEILNKTAQREAAARPGCRVVSFNWGPWAGGMVNPSLEKLFKSEGLTTIPLQEGAAYMVDELASGPDGPVEIVILGAGSRLPEEAMVGPKTDGSVPRVTARRLSIDQAPVLASHVIDSQAVLPLAVMMEWMIQAAVQDSPPDQIMGLEALEVHHRLTLDAGQTVEILVTVEPDLEPGSRQVFLEARDGSQSKRYAQGTAQAIDPADPNDAPRPLSLTGAYPHNGRFYEEGRLFHGPNLQGLVEIEGIGPEGIAGRIRTAPPSNQWFKDAGSAPWFTDPLVLDSVFQMVILWCWEQHGRPALPVRVGRYRPTGRGFPDNGQVRARVHIKPGRSPKVTADIDITDLDGRLLARLDDVVCFESDALIDAYRQNRLSPPPAADTEPDSFNSQFWPADHQS